MMANMVLIALLVIGCVSAFLAWHEQYEDGLFGRMWLAGMVASTAIILIGEVTDAAHYDFSLETGFLFICIALFMLRHLLSFLRHIK